MAAADLWWAEEGNMVEVEWSKDDWWPATVTEVFDYPGSCRTLYIDYGKGWKKHNEWVGDAARVRPSIGAVNLELEDFQRAFGTTEGALVDGDELLFEVEFVCGKRVAHGITEYRVQWVGDYEKKDKRSWEPPENIHAEYIELYEAQQQERDAAKKAKSKPTPPLRARLPPHTLTTVDGRSDELKKTYESMAEFIDDGLGQAASTLVARASEPSAKQPRQFFDGPISEELFYGIHARFRAAAVGLPGEAAQHVTGIVAVAGSDGGPRVCDQFKVATPDILDRMVAPFVNPRIVQHGPLVVRNGSTLVQLLTPLTFKFTTTRGVAKPKRRLRTYAHVGVLQTRPELTWKLPEVGKLEDEQSNYRHAHKTAMATAIRDLAASSPGAVSEEVTDWLNSPAGRLLA